MENKFKILHDSILADWIDNHILKDSKVNYVNRIIPNLYSHYFKFYFPVGLIEDEEPVQKTYNKIAEIAELDFAKNFSFTNLIKKYKGLPENFVIMKDNNIAFIDELINIFGKDTNAIFYDFGDDVYPEIFEQSWIVTNKFLIIKDIYEQLNEDNYHDFNHFPTYMFSEDKSWCIGAKVFQSGILLVGCNELIAGKIYSQKTIEYVELNQDDEYFEFLKQN